MRRRKDRFIHRCAHTKVRSSAQLRRITILTNHDDLSPSNRLFSSSCRRCCLIGHPADQQQCAWRPGSSSHRYRPTRRRHRTRAFNHACSYHDFRPHVGEEGWTSSHVAIVRSGRQRWNSDSGNIGSDGSTNIRGDVHPNLPANDHRGELGIAPSPRGISVPVPDLISY